MMSAACPCSNRNKLIMMGLLAFSISCCYVVTTFQISCYTQRLHKPDGEAFDIRKKGVGKMAAKDGNTIQNCSCSSNINDFSETEPDKISSGATSRLAVPSNDKTKMKDSLTGTLWNFKDTEDEKLYLYESVLKRWNPNATNARKFREELARHLDHVHGHDVVLNQENVKMNQKLEYTHLRKDSNNKPRSVTPAFFNLLPKKNPFPASERLKSCSIVGNSGSLKKSGCGRAIDKSDFVFRCNIAPMKPFEVDAGIKSNFTSINPSLIWWRYGSLRNQTYVERFRETLSKYNGYVWIPCMYSSNVFSISYKAMDVCKEHKPKTVCVHPAHMASVGKFWSSITNRISTGFYLAITSVALCEEVNLFGFWPFSNRVGEIKMSRISYHYYDRTGSGRAKNDHVMDKEFSILVQLHQLGIVRLHVGACS